jgi:hypothetical protein
MSFHPRRSTGEPSGSLELPVEEWPFLEQPLLLPSRSHRVCLTCHWFRHHAAPQCVPLLTCQLHQGLISHGEHLTRRCTSWTEDQLRRSGWAPEAA